MEYRKSADWSDKSGKFLDFPMPGMRDQELDVEVIQIGGDSDGALLFVYRDTVLTFEFWAREENHELSEMPCTNLVYVVELGAAFSRMSASYGDRLTPKKVGVISKTINAMFLAWPLNQNVTRLEFPQGSIKAVEIRLKGWWVNSRLVDETKFMKSGSQ